MRPAWKKLKDPMLNKGKARARGQPYSRVNQCLPAKTASSARHRRGFHRVCDSIVDVGPFARIRPGTHLQENSRVGNFVEIKNTQLGVNSKASHLSYLGDSEIGRNVNIGAGTITCNYDGVNKHQTVIGDRVFVGSDSQLVAPITVEDGATIGAGTTLTRTAPAETLTLTRSAQWAT